MKNKKGYTDHHLIYPTKEKRQQELTIPIRTKEHWGITIIQRYRKVSWGFIVSILFELFKLSIRKIYLALLKDAKEVEK